MVGRMSDPGGRIRCQGSVGTLSRAFSSDLWNGRTRVRRAKAGHDMGRRKGGQMEREQVKYRGFEDC